MPGEDLAAGRNREAATGIIQRLRTVLREVTGAVELVRLVGWCGKSEIVHAVEGLEDVAAGVPVESHTV